METHLISKAPEVITANELPADLLQKIEALQEAILSAHPQMPMLLRTIHKQLKEEPSNVTLLTEDQIASIVNGLKKVTKTELLTATLKKTTVKSLKNTTVDDL